MLIITRGSGQELTLGADTRITVLSIGTGKVKLGILAPDDVPVHRSEVAKAMQAADGIRGGHSLAGRRRSGHGLK